MIIVNEKKFSKENEITDSLFVSGGTVSGYYRVTGNKTYFYNLQCRQILVVERVLSDNAMLNGIDLF